MEKDIIFPIIFLLLILINQFIKNKNYKNTCFRFFWRLGNYITNFLFDKNYRVLGHLRNNKKSKF